MFTAKELKLLCRALMTEAKRLEELGLEGKVDEIDDLYDKVSDIYLTVRDKIIRRCDVESL